MKKQLFVFAPPALAVFIIFLASCKKGEDDMPPVIPTIPSTIVFQAGTGDAREIWRIDPDGNNLVQLTNNSVGDYVPAISPDGSKIAFVRAGSLYTMNADGTGEKLLAYESNASHPAWSPDGSAIAYTAFSVVNQIFFSGDIKVCYLNGQAPITLASTPNDEHHPSWSPDGATVIYSRDPNSSTLLDIYRVSATGGTQEQIFVSPTVSEKDPTYSPDGMKIAFSDYENIFAVNASGVGNPIQLTSTSDNRFPSWSPDGTKIAYTNYLASGSSDIWIMNADGSNQVNLTDTPNLSEAVPNWGRKL